MKNRFWEKAITRISITSLLLFMSGLAIAENSDTTQAFDNLTNLQSDDLLVTRGRTGETILTVQSNQDLNANITGSSFEVGTINSGGVSFSEGALENFSGVGLFNVVTGNNNAVNTSIGVTVNLQ